MITHNCVQGKYNVKIEDGVLYLKNLKSKNWQKMEVLV